MSIKRFKRTTNSYVNSLNCVYRVMIKKRKSRQTKKYFLLNLIYDFFITAYVKLWNKVNYLKT